MSKPVKKRYPTVLIVIGSICMVLGIIFAVLFNFMSAVMDESNDIITSEASDFQRDGAIKTTGTITSVTPGSSSGEDEASQGSTTVEYYVESEDQEYEISFPVYNTKYGVGATIDVYYGQEDSARCIAPILYTETIGMVGNVFSIVGWAVGGVLFLAGAVCLIAGIVARKKIKAQAQTDAMQEM